MNFKKECPKRAIIKVKNKFRCWHCGKPTYFADIDFGAYLCSTECQDAKIKEFFESGKKEPMKNKEIKKLKLYRVNWIGKIYGESKVEAISKKEARKLIKEGKDSRFKILDDDEWKLNDILEVPEEK